MPLDINGHDENTLGWHATLPRSLHECWLSKRAMTIDRAHKAMAKHIAARLFGDSTAGMIADHVGKGLGRQATRRLGQG
jgi:hypothetical protein